MTLHYLKWGTRVGALARAGVMRIGLLMIRAARALLKWSGGRCSWCGADCGFSSSVSRKGLRCCMLDRNCERF